MSDKIIRPIVEFFLRIFMCQRTDHTWETMAGVDTKCYWCGEPLYPSPDVPKSGDGP